MISACCEVLCCSLVASQEIEIWFTGIIYQECATGAKLGKINIGGNRGSICPPRVQDHCKGQYEKSSDRKTDHCRAFLCRTRPVRNRHLPRADALFRRNRQFPRARCRIGTQFLWPPSSTTYVLGPSTGSVLFAHIGRPTRARNAVASSDGRLSLQLFVAAGGSSEPSHRIPDYQRRWRFWCQGLLSPSGCFYRLVSP